MQKIVFEILVLTALTVGLIWTILELTPKSALLSLTILSNRLILFGSFVRMGGPVKGLICLGKKYVYILGANSIII